MQNEIPKAAKANQDNAADADLADCRDPQPRDPVAHPRHKRRPPLARRVIVDHALEPGRQTDISHH